MKAREEEKRERLGKAALRNEGNGNVIIGKVAFQVGEKKNPLGILLYFARLV